MCWGGGAHLSLLYFFQPTEYLRPVKESQMFTLRRARGPTITYLLGTFASWGRGVATIKGCMMSPGLLHHGLHISQLNRNLVFKEPSSTSSISADMECPLPAGRTECCGPCKAANELRCLQTDLLQNEAKMYTISCHQEPMDCRESAVSGQKQNYLSSLEESIVEPWHATLSTSIEYEWPDLIHNI